MIIETWDWEAMTLVGMAQRRAVGEWFIAIETVESVARSFAVALLVRPDLFETDDTKGNDELLQSDHPETRQ